MSRMGKNLKINRGIINLPVKIAFFFFLLFAFDFQRNQGINTVFGEEKKSSSLESLTSSHDSLGVLE